MCGRYVSPKDLAVLREVFELTALPDHELTTNFNVSPTQEVYTILTNQPDGLKAVTKQWGLTASWNPKQKIANARSETVASKSSFKELFLNNRCLVPMQGYYEWFRPSDESKKKQPFYIYSEKMKLLPVAGIFQENEVVILTQAANKKLEKIHDRMPVLVPPKYWQQWLANSDSEAAVLRNMIVPVPDDLLTAYPVGIEVNSSRSQGVGLISPIGEAL
jgi:putative SOS response-associated peptidase YedK